VFITGGEPEFKVFSPQPTKHAVQIARVKKANVRIALFFHGKDKEFKL